MLEALQETDGGPLSFGEIRDRVGVDNPGQCHYHLDQLYDRFVQQGEDGYGQSPAGWWLVGALRSGALTSTLTVQSVSADGSCLDCGGEFGRTLPPDRCDGRVDLPDRTDRDVPPAFLDDWPLEELPQSLSVFQHAPSPDLSNQRPRCLSGAFLIQAPLYLAGLRPSANRIDKYIDLSVHYKFISGQCEYPGLDPEAIHRVGSATLLDCLAGC